MKWFKHLSCSHADEKLVELIRLGGIEAYGFWWMVMEIVASQMDETDKCCASYSLSHWSHLLYSHHKKVSKALDNLRMAGLIALEYEGDKIKITIHNLLKYRDEYSKKSGQSPDKLRSKKEKEKEKEKEKKEEKPSSSSSPEEMPTQAREEMPPTAMRMTTTDFRFLWNEAFGTVMPGGCNEKAGRLCREFTKQPIREAFQAAAIHGKPNLAYVEGVLRGNGTGKARASPSGPGSSEQESLQDPERRDKIKRHLERKITEGY